jgi:predicted S18 family serine protease
LWHGVNTICGRKTSQTESLTLINPVNGVSTSDNNECASIFADAFKNKVTKLVEQVGQSEVMTDYISRKFEKRTISTQSNTNEIVEVVMSLKKSTSTGPYDISINYIKDAVVELSPDLKFIFDKAASLAITPTQWKRAKIIAIHKKGERMIQKTTDLSLCS